MKIHSTAIADSSAELGRDVSIGPFCVIEPNTMLGDRCRMESRSVIKAGTKLGSDNHVFEGAMLGGLPQHLQLPDQTGGLKIGSHNTFRENCTVHRGLHEGDDTVVGDHNLVMINTHIAHDCQIGHHVVLINNVMIAGHVMIEDRAYIAGGAAVQQFRRVGQLAAVGGFGRAVKDVPPYVTLDGYTNGVVGLNFVGLRRAGYTRDDVSSLKAAYRLIYRSGLPWQEILEQLETEFTSGPAADFYPFFVNGKYGFMPERRTPAAATIKLYREDEGAEQPHVRAGKQLCPPLADGSVPHHREAHHALSSDHCQDGGGIRSRYLFRIASWPNNTVYSRELDLGILLLGVRPMSDGRQQRVPNLVLIVGLAIITLVANQAQAENWPGSRGSRGDGTSSESGIPIRWDGEAGNHVAWKTPISGVGHASPIVWNDRVYVASCVEDEQRRVLQCLDREDGRIVWERDVLHARLETKHKLNSYASGTPVTDGQRVFVSFFEPSDRDTADIYKPARSRSAGNMVVAAYDLDGKQLWMQRPGRFASVHGYCSSPVLYGDTVIINGDHDGDAYLVALDQATGKTRWKVERANKTRSYSTPIIREIDDRVQMILSGSKCVASYDPNSGQRHWIIDGPTEQFVASVVYNEPQQILFVTAGFPDRHMLAIRPTGNGNVTDSHIAWRTTKGCSYVPSPINVKNYFLVVADTGVASCFDVESGERFWMSRLGGHYSASLVSAGGLVYFLSDDGVTKIVEPGRKLKVIAENRLGERCYASPAISDGQLFIRGERHLWCIGDAGM